jgi:hypothetical protein
MAEGVLRRLAGHSGAIRFAYCALASFNAIHSGTLDDAIDAAQA